MKVVVRSSSLLFTLLSIVLQAPIRRTKRLESGTESSGENNGQDIPPARYHAPADSHAPAALASGGHRNPDLL
jgi:hypothetical protein